jgi:hypothetical protein
VRRRRPVRVTAWERLVADAASDDLWMKLGMSAKRRAKETRLRTLIIVPLLALLIIAYFVATQRLFGASHWPQAIGFATALGMLRTSSRTTRFVQLKWRLLVRDRLRISWLDDLDGGERLKARHELWIRKIEGGSPTWHPYHLHFFWAFVLLMLGLAAWHAVLALGLGPFNTWRLAGPLLIVVLFAVLMRRGFSGFRQRRSLTRLQAGQCIDCGYSLAELPSRRLATRDGGSISVGPERCPECGCPWPMVPPRALEDVLGRGGREPPTMPSDSR